MMAEEGTQQLPYVRETVLKKRKVNEDWAVKNRERKAAKRQRRRDDGKGAIKRPEDFVREFRNKELDFVRMKTRLKVRKLPPAETLNSKLVFAIRIPGSVLLLYFSSSTSDEEFLFLFLQGLSLFIGDDCGSQF